MPRYYASIPFGWLDAKSPQEAVDRLLAVDPGNDHEGVTFLVREGGSDRLVLIVVRRRRRSRTSDAGRHGRLGVPLRVGLPDTRTPVQCRAAVRFRHPSPPLTT
jgi:hypothetical protein